MHSVPRSTATHVAWLLPSGMLFFSCGILLGRITTTWYWWLFLAALGGVACLFSRHWRRFAAGMTILLCAGALLGWHAWNPSVPPEGSSTVRGTISQEVICDPEGHVQTVLSGVTLNGEFAGDAYWTFYLDGDEMLPDWLRPGAQVQVTARVYHPSGQMNPGGFSFQEYLLQRGITYGLYGAEELVPAETGFCLQGWIAGLRHDLTLRLMDVMGEEAGSYAAAMLLGTKDFIPEDDRAAFTELGIAHILSVSGYHVGVLAGLLMLLLHPLPCRRSLQFLIEAGVLGFYCLLTGGNAPVLRAAGLLLWREYTRVRNRQILPLHILCVTALLQLVFQPTQLTSASFQLSYGAMLGLTLVFPWLKKRLACRSRFCQKMWEAFAAAFSAQLGVLLPQLYWFGELPLLSILLNMAVMAIVGGLMSLYWVTLAALPIPGLRLLLGSAAKAATRLLLSGIRGIAALNFTTLWTRQADIFTLIGWGLLLLGLSSLIPRRLERRRPWILCAGVALMLLILLPLPRHETTYTQFSVGDADAAILQDQDVTVVIDVGEDDQTVASYLHQRRQSIDMLIITHLHSDHAGGIHALLNQNIPVEVCYLPVDAGVPLIDEEVLPLLLRLMERGTEFRTLCRGDVIDLPSGRLNVLWPEEGRVSTLHDANDVCLVLQADIAGVTMMLTSDLSGAYESCVQMPADILKAAHHGSSTSTSAEFLGAVEPQLILLSNRSESREVRMQELAGEIPLYSTEQCGAVTVCFQGEGEFAVETVRTP